MFAPRSAPCQGGRGLPRTQPERQPWQCVNRQTAFADSPESPYTHSLGAARRREASVSNYQLRAEPRSIVGKKVRFLRREGLVPGNIYGHTASTAVQLSARDVEQTIYRAGRTQLISLEIAGSEATTVLVQEWQRHPSTANLLHVDFYRVAIREPLRMHVPIRLTGEARHDRLTGGSPFQPLS